MTTKPRTPEERYTMLDETSKRLVHDIGRLVVEAVEAARREADEEIEEIRGQHYKEIVALDEARKRAEAALREAADAARQEEREALRRWIDRRRDHHGVNAIVYAEGLLTWLDARSKDSR